jgi:hypothetical protein
MFGVPLPGKFSEPLALEPTPTHFVGVGSGIKEASRGNIMPRTITRRALVKGGLAAGALEGRDELYRPSGRVTMLIRRTQAGWRAIHYHESALAAQAADQINRLAK